MDEQYPSVLMAAVEEEAGGGAVVGLGRGEAADQRGEEVERAVEGLFKVVDYGSGGGFREQGGLLVGGGVGEEEAHLNVFEEEELQVGRCQSDPSRGVDGDRGP